MKYFSEFLFRKISIPLSQLSKGKKATDLLVSCNRNKGAITCVFNRKSFSNLLSSGIMHPIVFFFKNPHKVRLPRP